LTAVARVSRNVVAAAKNFIVDVDECLFSNVGLYSGVLRNWGKYEQYHRLYTFEVKEPSGARRM